MLVNFSTLKLENCCYMLVSNVVVIITIVIHYIQFGNCMVDNLGALYSNETLPKFLK